MLGKVLKPYGTYDRRYGFSPSMRRSTQRRQRTGGAAMRDEKNKRNRNTALLLIGTGLFLLLEHKLGFFVVIALLFILLGAHHIRSRSNRRGYVLVAIGAVILFGANLTFILAIIFISLGYFYIKSKQLHRDDTYLQKQTLVDSIRWGQEPWILRNTSIWYVIGEFNMDLSLAILEQKETTVILQGVIGDVDIIVPEDIGVSVQASVMFGQIDVAMEKEAGLMNKLVWQSPNYNTCDHRVKLVLSYIVGDIDIKIL
jgi:lia operon protein LiaF